MKRSEPPKRKKPLPRQTTPLKRTAIKRKPTKDREAAASFQEVVLRRENYRCQGGPKIILVDLEAGRGCRGKATEAHHREPRGMGGHGNNDPSNGLALCDPCHKWVESNRKLAYELDLLRKHDKRVDKSGPDQVPS